MLWSKILHLCGNILYTIVYMLCFINFFSADNLPFFYQGIALIVTVLQIVRVPNLKVKRSIDLTHVCKTYKWFLHRPLANSLTWNQGVCQASFSPQSRCSCCFFEIVLLAIYLAVGLFFLCFRRKKRWLYLIAELYRFLGLHLILEEESNKWPAVMLLSCEFRSSRLVTELFSYVMIIWKFQQWRMIIEYKKIWEIP